GKTDDEPADTVQDAQRPVEHAAVLITALAHRVGQHLAQPSQKGVGKEQIGKLIKSHKKLLLVRPAGYRRAERPRLPAAECGSRFFFGYCAGASASQVRRRPGISALT